MNIKCGHLGYDIENLVDFIYLFIHSFIICGSNYIMSEPTRSQAISTSCVIISH
jgi:hypothetical protein